MKYMIMFLIVVGLSISDITTGMIKAHVQNDYSSRVMRAGLYHKCSEWLVMGTAIGLEYGLTLLGTIYNSPELAGIAGAVTAVSVFVYITAMEVISIFENYAEINPQANFARNFIKKLRKFSGDEDKNE